MRPLLLLAVSSCAGLLPTAPSARPSVGHSTQPQQGPTLGSLGMTRRSALLTGIGAAALLSPRAAEASFGSARGAVTSPPKVSGVNLQRLESLDPNK